MWVLLLLLLVFRDDHAVFVDLVTLTVGCHKFPAFYCLLFLEKL